MALPKEWIEKIFERMSLHYGSRFTSMWAGVDAEKLKAHWAHELAGLVNCPEVIGHALDHMPDERPPTLGEFRRLCHNAPRKPVPLLPAPKADPDRVKALLVGLKERLMQQRVSS